LNEIAPPRQLKRSASSLFLCEMKIVIIVACIGLLALGSTHVDATNPIVDVPTLEHCALVANPAPYDGKEIRVRGIYSVCGPGDSKFFSSACSDGKSLWVEFDPSYQTDSNPKAVKSLLEMTRKSGARSVPHRSQVLLDYRAANVEFVGRFAASNPYKQTDIPPTDLPFGPFAPNRNGYDYVFHVLRVERVKPLPKNANY
jgi:hypothetical protein